MTNINFLSDFEKGEYDCVHNQPLEIGANQEYLDGYGQEYARQETISGQHVDQTAQCKSQLEQWGISL